MRMDFCWPIFVLPESPAALVGCVFVLPKLGTEFFYPRSNSLEIIVVGNIRTMSAATQLRFRSGV